LTVCQLDAAVRWIWNVRMPGVLSLELRRIAIAW
jgi:hypothetical protein